LLASTVFSGELLLCIFVFLLSLKINWPGFSESLYIS